MSVQRALHATPNAARQAAELQNFENWRVSGAAAPACATAAAAAAAVAAKDMGGGVATTGGSSSSSSAGAAEGPPQAASARKDAARDESERSGQTSTTRRWLEALAVGPHKEVLKALSAVELYIKSFLGVHFAAN